MWSKEGRRDVERRLWGEEEGDSGKETDKEELEASLWQGARRSRGSVRDGQQAEFHQKSLR